jgi:hypothetical protein
MPTQPPSGVQRSFTLLYSTAHSDASKTIPDHQTAKESGLHNRSDVAIQDLLVQFAPEVGGASPGVSRPLNGARILLSCINKPLLLSSLVTHTTSLRENVLLLWLVSEYH